MVRTLRFGVLAAGIALGVFSLAVAWGGAGNSYGGGSAAAGAAELAASYALLGVGLAAMMRRRQARLGAGGRQRLGLDPGNDDDQPGRGRPGLRHDHLQRQPATGHHQRHRLRYRNTGLSR